MVRGFFFGGGGLSQSPLFSQQAFFPTGMLYSPPQGVLVGVDGALFAPRDFQGHHPPKKRALPRGGGG